MVLAIKYTASTLLLLNKNNMPNTFSAMLVAAVSLLQSSAAKVSIDSESRNILDDQGRALLLHGVNVVYKVDPYIPSSGEFDSEDSLNDEDIQNLVDWGFNFVRLGVMWEAVERERDIYDDNYLSQVETLVNKLGEKGIYTMVDMH
jgi:endoglycosylceramidase